MRKLNTAMLRNTPRLAASIILSYEASGRLFRSRSLTGSFPGDLCQHAPMGITEC